MNMRIQKLIIIIFIGFSLKSISQCIQEAEDEYKYNINPLLEKAKEYGLKGDYDNEIKLSKKAVDLTLKVEKKHHCFSPIAFWQLSEAYIHVGEYAKALQYAMQGYQISENFFKQDDCADFSYSAMKVGNVYLAMGDDSSALKYYQKGLDICKKNSIVVIAFINISKAEISIKNNDYQNASKLLDDAEIIAKFIGDTYDVAQVILSRVYLLRGLILFNMGQCDDALPKLLSSLQIAESKFDRITMGKCFFYIALIYDLKANYDDAISNYLESSKISSSMGMKDILYKSKIKICDIQFTQGLREKTINTISELINTLKKENFNELLVDAYNAKAFYQGEMGNLEDLHSFANAALSKAKEIEYYRGIAEAYNNLETYYEIKRDYKLAKEQAILALKYAEQVNYYLVMCDALNDLGDIYMSTGKIDSSYYFYNLALQSANKGYINNCGMYKEGVIDSYNKIGNYYKKKGKKNLAYENFFRALELSKDINYEQGMIEALNGIRSINGLKKVSFPKNEKEKKEFFKHLYNYTNNDRNKLTYE